jgi:hypothetical protein
MAAIDTMIAARVQGTRVVARNVVDFERERAPITNPEAR